jgi:hypothetical protein
MVIIVSPFSRIRPFPQAFPLLIPSVFYSMQHSLAHQDPQFAINVKFDSFSALKHACTRAALLDVYKFVP